MTVAVNPPAAAPEGLRTLPAGGGSHWIVRLPLALLLAFGALELFLSEKLVRGLEVTLSSHILPGLFASKSTAILTGESPVVLFLSGGSWLGLRVTPECAIAFYVGAILLFGAAMLLIPRFGVLRILLATAIAGATMILLNQARLAALAWVFAAYGHDAFEWAHSIGGSFLMLGGLAVDLSLFFLVVIRGKRRRRPDRGPGNEPAAPLG